MDKKNLDYHRFPVPGKLRIEATKPCNTQDELSMAYSPGVADPCNAIHDDGGTVYDYTAKSNFVAVVSDGSAVLGLGDIGPHAGIPVMEGKSVLFKRFAGIDSIGICLSHVRKADGRTDAEKIIETVERLEPSFGGINLEDIGAPACFEIERELKKKMPIPVFHDDQHGTAIICTAGIMNSLQLLGKKRGEVKVVINGAGAAGISCAEMCVNAGVRSENITMCDSRGVIFSGREGTLSSEKARFAVETKARSLGEALEGADVFLGLSIGNCVTKGMISKMNRDPVVFAMANPIPEISPAEALAGGAAVVGTGRSDFHNQVNNVLGFPGIFRGALDTRSRTINEEMKMAAAMALADLAKRKIPEDVKEYLFKAYPEEAAEGVFDGENPLKKEYVIPKPFDPRVVPHVARAVAEAAIKTKAAGIIIGDLDAYERSVAQRISGE